jgi:hypothetical protein
MNQHKPYRRFLTMLLSVVMALVSVPASAAAEEILPGTGVEIISFGGLEKAERAVPPGTALEDLDLPENLTAMVCPAMDTKDGEEAQSAGAMETTVPVTWVASPAYDSEKAGVYIFTAEVEGFAVNAELPSITVTVDEIVDKINENSAALDGMDGSTAAAEEILPQTGAELQPVAVVADEIKGSITTFDELTDDIRWQNTTQPFFPETLAGTVEDKTVQIPVTWEADHEYNTESPLKGLYVFTAHPAEGYTLGNGVEAPRITVYIPMTTAHTMTLFMSGGETADTSISITNADQLAEISALVNGGRLKSFLFNDESSKAVLVLQNDIDLSNYGRNWNGGKGWMPIGYDSGKPFQEIFDGGGYKITGLFIETTAGNHYCGTGLFGCVDDGTVQNLGIIDMNITGGGYTGGVAGTIASGSMVQNCYATGSIRSEGYAGGVTGSVNGSSTVQNCYSACIVNGTNYAGGLVGMTAGGSMVQNCYATGIVSGSDYVGGVAGWADGTVLQNCAGLGSRVTASSDMNIGRITGFQGSGTFSGNAAFDGMTLEVNGTKKTAVGDASGKDGEDKSAAEIKEENFWTVSSGFTGNWDTSVWTITAGSLPGLFGVAADMPIHIVDGGNPDFPGAGTQENPYQISNAAQLAKMAELVNDLGTNPVYGGVGIYYKLTADIDLSGYNSANTTFNGGRGWVPIGYGDFNTFQGNFDGDGHKITGLYIRTTTGNHYDSTGLFGSLFGGKVRNIGVEGADITGYNNVGGIAGYIYNNSLVQNCYATGAVTGNNNVGGVVGVVRVSSKVQSSHAAGTVTGNECVGGLAGLAKEAGIVQNCYSDGLVTGFQCVGGVAGYIEAEGNVENCYAAAAVEGTRCVGGIAGAADGNGAKVKNCYSTGAVNGVNDETGGVAGYVYNGGTVENCFAAGTVAGGTKVGGVVGVVNPYGTVQNCAALNPGVSGNSKVGRVAGVIAAGGISSGNIAFGGMIVTENKIPKAVVNDANGVDGKSKDAAALKTSSGFPEALRTNPWSYEEGKCPVLLDSDGEKILPEQNTALPYHISGHYFAGGDGTSERPYEIASAAQLAKLAELVNAGTSPYAETGKYYKLTASIDLSDYRSGEGWIPIGTGDTAPFKGVFDGGGKMITGLYAKRAGAYTGLFGYVEGGTVRNLGIIGAGVAGSTGSYTGGVAGIVDDTGMVESCYVTGTVSGTSNVGGIAGSLNGSIIQNCYTTCRVEAIGDNAGGVAGNLDGGGTVQNCYTTGAVSGVSGIGGVAGSISGNSTVKNSVGLNSGVSGINNAGRVVGYNNGSILINNYAFSGMRNGSAKTLSGLDGEDVTIAQINTAAFWTNASNWNISDWNDVSIWAIADNNLPLLKKAENPQPGRGLYLTERDISKAAVTINGTFIYTGSEIVPELSAVFDGETLKEGVDYTVSLESNINAGTAVAILSGRNNFKGTKNINFTIGKKLVAKENLECDLTAVVYNGTEQPVSVTEKDGLNGFGDITVKYDGKITVPVNAGKYAVTVDISEGLNYEAVAGLPLGNYTVEKKEVIVKADDKIIKAGNLLPAATLSYTGFIGTDSEDNALAVKAMAEYDDAVSAAKSGTFPVRFSVNAVLNDTVGANYTLVHQNGILTVMPEEIIPEKKDEQPVSVTSTASAASAEAENAARMPEAHEVIVITDTMVLAAVEKAQLDAKIKGSIIKSMEAQIFLKASSTAGFTLVIERAALNRLVREGRPFKISGLPVTFQFDLSALKDVQKQSGGDISISVNPAATEGLRSTFDIEITSTEKGKPVVISSLGSGSVIIGIVAGLGKEEFGGCLYGAAVGADKKISRISKSVYDANSGRVIFTANHFQVYGIAYMPLDSKFMDISGHWAKESIDYAAGRGLIDGISDTRFSPDSSMTREMLAAALGKLAGVDVSGYKTSSFTDVARDKAYAPYIEWAYRKGIMKGTGNRKFAPERTVTREEMAVIMENFARAAGYVLPVKREAAVYADNSSIGNTCKKAVKATQQAGIMMGESANRFNPKSGVTRGEFSAILYRYIKLTISPDTTQGWALNDSGQYLYYKDGKILTGRQVIAGAEYSFGADGTLLNGNRH